MKKQALALAVGLASVQPQFVHALSLGALQVDSALSQPLRARIDLHDMMPGSLSDLSVRVASDGLFQRMGMERSYALNNLRFDAVMHGDQPSLLIHTRYPFNEPFLNLLLEVSHLDSVVLQEYMLMPELPPTPAQGRADGGRRYTVSRGDTLLKIASRFRYAGTNSNQMMLALLKRNPQAFIRGNANRLKANVTLVIPARQAVRSISRRDAQVFRGQLVKNTLSQRSLAKQPVAQPERSEEARSEVDKARQHLQSLKQKNEKLTTQLTPAIVEKKVTASKSTGDVSLATVRRLHAQMEVKDLKIAELQMRLARLNKKLLINENEADSAQAGHPKQETTLGVSDVGGHVIDMEMLTTSKEDIPLLSDIEEVDSKPPAVNSRLNSPIAITTITETENEAHASQPLVPKQLAAVVDVGLIAEEQSSPLADTKETAVRTENVAPVAAEEALPQITPESEVADDQPSEQASTDFLALLGSPLVLYIEMGVFFLLAVLWLYARYQRRKWRLVDDVVRELEAKRDEEGRLKMVWDKLVYAPDEWLIDLPHIPGPEHLNYLPAVEQFETLLMNTKSCGLESGNNTVAIPESEYHDVNDELPAVTQSQNLDVVTPRPAPTLAVDDADKLRQQIEEMQHMLEQLQQHRDYLQQQRSAA